MATTAEIEKLALELPEAERGRLALQLLRSLPATVADDDEGLAEALRRDAELSDDPTIGVSAEEFARMIAERPRRCS